MCPVIAVPCVQSLLSYVSSHCCPTCPVITVPCVQSLLSHVSSHCCPTCPVIAVPCVQSLPTCPVIAVPRVQSLLSHVSSHCCPMCPVIAVPCVQSLLSHVSSHCCPISHASPCSLLGVNQHVFDCTGIDSSLKPYEVSVEDYVRLAQYLAASDSRPIHALIPRDLPVT